MDEKQPPTAPAASSEAGNDTLPRVLRPLEVVTLVAATRNRGGFSVDRCDQLDEIVSSLTAMGAGAIEHRAVYETLFNRLNAELRVIRLERAQQALANWALLPGRDYTVKITREASTRVRVSVCLHAARVRSYYARIGSSVPAALESALTTAMDHAEQWAAQVENAQAHAGKKPPRKPKGGMKPHPATPLATARAVAPGGGPAYNGTRSPWWRKDGRRKREQSEPAAAGATANPATPRSAPATHSEPAHDGTGN